MQRKYVRALRSAALSLFIFTASYAQTFEIPITPNVPTDSSAAIQATINQAEEYVASTNNTQIATVRFPNGGSYLIGKPLRIKSPLISVQGMSANLWTLYGEGVEIAVAPQMTMPIVKDKWVNDGLNNAWLNLRESKAWDLDGVTDFLIEFDMNAAVIYQHGNWIISSAGRELWNDNLSSAFEIYTDVWGINARVKIGGTNHWLHADAVQSNMDYHVALDYSQGTLSLSVNNQIVASEPATGALSQEYFEDVILGPHFIQFPESQLYGSSTTGTVDNLRLVTDGAERFNLQFNDTDGIFTRALTPYGNVWLTLRRTVLPSLGNVSISDLTFGSAVGTSPSGVMTMGAFGIRMERCRFYYPREGIRLSSNSFQATLRDIEIIGGQRVGIYSYRASGLSLIQNYTYSGRGYAVVGFAFNLTGQVFLHGPMRYAILASSDTPSSSYVRLDDVHISDEDGSEASKGLIALANIRQFIMIGGGLESVVRPRPLITVSGGISHAFYSTTFNVNPTQPSVFEFREVPVYPVAVFSPTNCQTGYPPTGCTGEAPWTMPKYVDWVNVIR